MVLTPMNREAPSRLSRQRWFDVTKEEMVNGQSAANPALVDLEFLSGEWDMELSMRHSYLVATTPLMGTSHLSGLKTVPF